MTFDPAISHEYMPSRWSPREDVGDVFIEKGLKYSDEIRTTLADSLEVVRYGTGPKQLLDVVKPETVTEETPVMIFIHGGYWVECSRDMFFYVMKCAFDRGFIGINVGYDQAPEVSLTTIVNQIRDAYTFISQKFPKSRQVVVTGHSAGGHLSAMLLATDWNAHNGLETILPISRCIPVSGIFDVRPVRHTCYNEQLKLTDNEVQELSPILLSDEIVSNIEAFGTIVCCVVAEHDPPKFKELSKEFSKALTTRSCDATYAEIKGTDHFDIITNLYEMPNFELNKFLFGEE